MKDELRKKLKIKRRYFQNIARQEADRAISEDFIAAFSGYDSFFIYNSFGMEADTRLIIGELLSLGKRVYLPRVEGGEIVAVPYGETRRGAFGIEEPVGRAFSGEIDIAVVPLLAVSPQGFRIGYGGGYYDRYLKKSSAKRVGLGYYFQFEDFTPDPWDEKLNYYVCERGIYSFDD